MIYEYYLRQIYKTLRRNYKKDMDKIIKFIFYMRQNYKEATAACGMLGNKYWMLFHRCLFTIIGNYGKCKAFGNEIIRLKDDLGLVYRITICITEKRK